MEWGRLLAYITGTVDQDLLLRNEYLAAENRILRGQPKGRLRGSRSRAAPGRPRIGKDVEDLIVRMAKENRSWGYDRIAGALANLGHEVSDQTVGNVLRRRGILPAPERKRTTTWAEFIRVHLAVLAGTDFFTVEVLTIRGLVTYYVLFFIHLESRKVHVAGITFHPNEQWMQQIATERDHGRMRLP
jgi:putative transposase